MPFFVEKNAWAEMMDGPFKSSKAIPHWLDFISCCRVVEPLVTSQSFISKKSGLHIVSRICCRIPLQVKQFFVVFFSFSKIERESLEMTPSYQW